jgi:biopolymer transport protein ExbD
MLHIRNSAKRSQPISTIDVTAFAAVLLVLVSAYMLALSRPDRFHAAFAWIDPPRAYHAAKQHGAIREDALVVTMARDGKIWFRDDPVNLSTLPNAIRDSVKKGAPTKVYLRIDQRAAVGRVNLLLEAIRSAGIENVAFWAQ